MIELTLESLADRVKALEVAVATGGADKQRSDWRNVVGMFRDSEFMRDVDEESRKLREAERVEARKAGADE